MLLKGQQMPHLYLSIPVPLTAVSCFSYSSSGVLPIQYDHSTRSSQSEELNLGLLMANILFLAGSHLTLELVPASVREYVCMSLAQLDLNAGWKPPKYEFCLGIASLSWKLIVSLC